MNDQFPRFKLIPTIFTSTDSTSMDSYIGKKFGYRFIDTKTGEQIYNDSMVEQEICNVNADTFLTIAIETFSLNATCMFSNAIAEGCITIGQINYKLTFEKGVCKLT